MGSDDTVATTPGSEDAGDERPCLIAIRHLVDGLEAPCAVLTADAHVVHVNPMLGRLLGAPPERMRGVALGSTGDPLGKQLRPAVLHVGDSGEPTTIDLVGPAMGMPELPRNFHIRLVPLPDDDGQVALVCAIGLGSRRSEAEGGRLLTRFEVLASAGRELLDSRSIDEGLQRLAALTIPHLADCAVVHLLEPVEEHEGPVAVAHVDDARAKQLRRQLADWRPPLEGGAYARVIDSGDGVLLDEMDEHAALRELGAERLAPMQSPPSSAVIVAVRLRGRVVGVLELLMARSARSHDETDLWIASELAARASQALENFVLVERLEDRAHAAKVLMHITDGVLLIGDDDVVRVWNPAAEAITGLPRQQVVGRPVGEAIPGWNEIAPTIPIREHAAAGGRAEHVTLDLDGQSVDVVISGSKFEDGIVYAFTDVADERRVERLKSEFIATVSHELRTPLASIYGAGATLRRQDIDIAEDQREDLLQLIVEQSERLASMISDILEVSMIDAGRAQPISEAVDVQPLLQEAIGHFVPLAPDGIEFELGDLDELPAVVADIDKLRRVMLNLVENAIKYSPEGGTVRVDASATGDTVRVEVHDQGIGIEPATQRRIFERFYRADPEHAEGISGTGLGLYISKELIHAMGGTIDVRSSPGKGSTFHVELPVAR